MKFISILLLSVFTILKSSDSIYDLNYQSIDGESLSLSEYKGKYILFVNVASQCGYTPQYKELQLLQDKYKDNLVIIGFPCNQFGNQEPGTNNEIVEFCEKNYGVTFPLSSKIDVKGDNQHPIYQWLTLEEKNGVMSTKVKWNFQKYLVSPDGQLINMFPSSTKPLSEEITKNF